MKTTFKKSFLNGNISAVSSKSIAHRVIILASFSDRPIKIYINKISKDVFKTLEIIKLFGAKVDFFDGGICVEKGERKFPQNINFGECGASLRFLLPYSFLEYSEIEFCAEGKLSQRPIKDLVNELEKSGIYFNSSELPFRGSGKFSEYDREFNFKGNISSQYISGLLMIAPFLKGKTVINISGKIESESYVNMTVSIMKKFGLFVKKTSSGYVVHSQNIFSPKEYYIEGDFSNMATIFSLGILNGDIHISNLSLNSIQGDSSIVSILKSVGANIEREKDGFRVKKSNISHFDLDCTDIPDLVPVLSALSLFSSGKSIFRNVSRLKFKESDRIKSIISMVERVGAKAEFSDGNLKIYPIKRKFLKKEVEIDVFNDHRLVMAASIISEFLGEVTINNFEAVYKSYPNFYEDLKKIGMEVECE